MLRDIIDSGCVPVVRLTRIFRQAQGSRIIMNAHRINKGEGIDMRGGKDADFFFATKESNQEVVDTVSYTHLDVYKRQNVVFKNMKSAKQSMAIVLDEYGGMVGIVTVLDLLEELVGDLNNIEEMSYEEESIEKIGDNKWEIIGNVRLSDIEEAIGVAFLSEDCETLTGLVFQKFGMVPKDGNDQIDLEIENLHVFIDKVEDHQVVHAIIAVSYTHLNM